VIRAHSAVKPGLNPRHATEKARRGNKWGQTRGALDLNLKAVAYWGVPDAAAAFARLVSLGAKEHRAVTDVGGGIRVGSVYDPFSNVLGIIRAARRSRRRRCPAFQARGKP
jgi:hypothetical protein